MSRSSPRTASEIRKSGEVKSLRRCHGFQAYARSSGTNISDIVPPPFAMPMPKLVSPVLQKLLKKRLITPKEARNGSERDQSCDIWAQGGRNLQKGEYRETDGVETPSPECLTQWSQYERSDTKKDNKTSSSTNDIVRGRFEILGDLINAGCEHRAGQRRHDFDILIFNLDNYLERCMTD